jgi:propionate CoA-transferase
MKRPDLLTPSQAVKAIRDGDVLLNTAMLLAGSAETILTAIEENYLAYQKPSGLTLLHAASQSDRVGGIEHLAHRGLVDTIIGSHWGLAPKWMSLIAGNEVIAYCLPQGQIVHLLREVASGSPGLFSKVGLGTFIDPRYDGGKMNQRTLNERNIVDVCTIMGEEYLHYLPILPNVAIIRGSSSDEDGNLSIEDEGVKLELMAAVLATKRNGGRIIAQVKRIVKNGEIHPQKVVVPGVFIDAIVLCENVQNQHRQCSSVIYDPAISGDVAESAKPPSPPPLGIRKVIGRRAALELRKDNIINMGIGIPNDMIAAIMDEEGMGDFATPTVESGIYGGVPLGGADFGVGIGCTSMLSHEQQFDFYDGTGVDIAFMGAGEIDKHGNVNSTKMGTHITGAGGFIDITQNAEKVVFCTTFTVKDLQCRIENNKLFIEQEGRIRKFVDEVSQISFNGKRAIASGQKVLYVTERAVFQLDERGITLIEIAEGMNLERDIMNNMGFKPMISDDLRMMDVRLYNTGIIGMGKFDGFK